MEPSTSDSRTLSLVPDAAHERERQREEYLAQLTMPADDMWASFAEAAPAFALRVGQDVAGCACVDEQKGLLRFYVRPRHQHRSTELLRLLVDEAGVRRMMVPTSDPSFLSSALDLAAHVETHSLLFSWSQEPAVPGLDGLLRAEPADRERVVAFQRRRLGAPRDFLESYMDQLLEQGEVFLHLDGPRLAAVGELRPDVHQEGVAHLGLVVGSSWRRAGVGSRLMSSLVTRALSGGRTPCCSTERTNVGARKAIERAGFRARHRLLEVLPAGRASS